MKRTLLLLLVLAAGGAWLIAGAGQGLRREHVTVAGTPLDVVHPPASGRRPGVVVAHGFSGSARLMTPFGDTLAARGYVVVLLDFSGHGADTRPLPDQTASTASSTDALEADLATAVAHLSSLPDVDPSRIALVGHSMGAGAVTRYAAAHPDVTATVAISLPSAVAASAERPARLLTVVGALEFPGFRAAAATVAAQRDDRAIQIIPGVEHITVLYAPATHRVTADWLDRAFSTPPAGGIRVPGGIPFPARRLAGAALLGLALLLGLHPLAAHLGERRATRPRPAPRLTITATTIVAAAVGALTARLLPTEDLPLAIGGYVAAYATVTGALLLLYATTRPPKHPRAAPRPPAKAAANPHSQPSSPTAASPPARRPHTDRDAGPSNSDTRTPHQLPPAPTAQPAPAPTPQHQPAAASQNQAARTAQNQPAGTGRKQRQPGSQNRSGPAPQSRRVTAPVSPGVHEAAKTAFRPRWLLLLGYAAVAIALPVHLGLTHALPVGDRWWLLLIIWAAFALLAYATEHVTAGDPIAVLSIAAVFVAVLAGAAVSGLTHGFVILVLFPLVGLLLWQALWSVFLNRSTAPTWAIALTGSLIVSWPLAVTLPLIS